MVSSAIVERSHSGNRHWSKPGTPMCTAIWKDTHPQQNIDLCTGPLVFESFSELSHCCPGLVGVDGCLGELLVAIELGADETTLRVE